MKICLYICNEIKTQKEMKTNNNTLLSKMESIISGIAGSPCEVVVLGKGRVYLSIIFDGNQTLACQKLAQFFGAKFDTYEYDEELDATYAGVTLE